MNTFNFSMAIFVLLESPLFENRCWLCPRNPTLSISCHKGLKKAPSAGTKRTSHKLKWQNKRPTVEPDTQLKSSVHKVFSPHILGTVYRVESMAACAWDTGVVALQWYSEVPWCGAEGRTGRHWCRAGMSHHTHAQQEDPSSAKWNSSGRYFSHIWK